MVPVAVAPAAQGMDEGLFGSARRRGREPFNRTRAEGGRVREHARGRGACPLDLPRIKGLALRDRDAPVRAAEESMLRVCFEMGELRRGRLEGCLLPV